MGSRFSSRSESDGTIDLGDHDFSRTTGRLQLLGQNSPTDLFADTSQDIQLAKTLHTPFDTYETENIKARLFVFNHKLNYKVSFIETSLMNRITDRYISANPAVLFE